MLTIPRGRSQILRAALQHPRALEEYGTFVEDLITLPRDARVPYASLVHTRAYSCLHISVPQPHSCAVSCRFRLTHPRETTSLRISTPGEASFSRPPHRTRTILVLDYRCLTKPNITSPVRNPTTRNACVPRAPTG
jgi:hypothetical protein